MWAIALTQAVKHMLRSDNAHKISDWMPVTLQRYNFRKKNRRKWSDAERLTNVQLLYTLEDTMLGIRVLATDQY
jgi:hypothetical protein